MDKPVASRLNEMVARFSICFAAMALFFLMTMGSATIPAQASPGMPESFSELAQTVSKSVVNISTVKTVKGGSSVFRQFHRGPFRENDPFHDFFNRFFGDTPHRDYKQRSLGSGVLFDKEGYIITNNHVIENADEILVKLNNEKEYKADIVGRDPNTDLALIRVKADEELPVAKLGDSESMKVGQWVVAIGNPFGLEQTVTAGIISAKGRVIGAGPYDDFIQTDASINPGNSGGPLINMDGEVIGINTAIVASGQGIGFAIPINIAKEIVEELKESGEVTRGWLGVAIQTPDESLAEYYGIEKGEGVLITEVFPGDPAAEAGIQANDIILSVDGKAINKSRTLSRLVAGMAVGQKAEIEVLREGKKKTFTVTIAERPDELAAGGPSLGKPAEKEFGIEVSRLTPEMARQMNLPQDEALVVTDVEEGSKGEEAGVMVGDVVKEINHQPVSTVKEYRQVIDNVKKGEAVQMVIKRRRTGFLVVKLMK